MQEVPIFDAEPQITSFWDRAADVFALPGKVFTEVAKAPVQRSSWLIPYLLLIVFSFISTYAILSNQTLKDQALEPQRMGMQERVDKGEMTQAQMDQAVEMMESSTMMIITGTVMSIIYTTISVFGAPLIFWIAVKIFFKAEVTYKKMLETYGLTLIITALNVVVTVAIIYVFQSIYASLGGALLVVGNYDPKNFVHAILSSINFISIWQMIVLGIGLGMISKKSTWAGVGLSMGLWSVWIIIMALVGTGLR
ncbi:MAG: YIP1 family protein [Ignavibacteriales bacterium]|nr:YIP1 family protein [Ignavibacteriales bacterium]